MPFEPLPSEKETLFPRDKENALLRRIQKESFPAPADADEELGQIILKASEPDKTRRYQHAREMHRDLLGPRTGIFRRKRLYLYSWKDRNSRSRRPNRI